jgi:hypothetical protein
MRSASGHGALALVPFRRTLAVHPSFFTVIASEFSAFLAGYSFEANAGPADLHKAETVDNLINSQQGRLSWDGREVR